MAIVNLLPLADYTAGVRSFGPVAIGDSVTMIELRVRRSTTADLTVWPSPLVSLTFDTELLVNGEWVSYGSGSSVGGIAFGKDGITEIPLSTFGGFLPMVTGRQIRGDVTISGGTLRTEVSVEVV